MAITHARVYIVRHGETEANRQGIFQGQLDTALNKAGIEQARMVGEFLRGVRFDKAFSSDLSRATKVCGFLVDTALSL
jgi:probable phosphoglycerate mutase